MTGWRTFEPRPEIARNVSKAPLSGFVRLFWAVVFALMGLCALSWWLLMPNGFAVAHPRFWSNGVLPWMWIAIASLGFCASIGAPALLQWLAFAPPAGLLSALLGILDANDFFSVVEATSAEKGPFRELGRGPLGRGDPLTLTLLDEGEARLQVVFVDWSAQLSAEASPSAGWGVPQNAVTFRRLGVDDNSPCEVELTLAATGVGRGFDSVAHAAGVYRNRVHIGPPD